MNATIWPALVAVTAVALALRLFGLGSESLWMDEIFQVSYYHLPLHRVLVSPTGVGQPPLDFLIGAGLDRLGLADSDAWVRAPAALFGSGSVFLLGWWIARIASPFAGILAAILLAVCPLHVAMSQEARPYTIFLFFALASVLAFAAARQRHTLLGWCAFTTVFVCMLFSRGIGPHFVTLGIVAYSLGTWVVCRRTGIADVRRGEHMKQWATVTALAIAYAIYNPFAGIIAYRMRMQGYAGSHEATPWTERFGDLLSQTFHALVGGYSAQTLSALAAPIWLAAMAGGLSVVGLIALLHQAKGKRLPLAALFAVTIVPFGVLYAAIYVTLTGATPKPQYLLPVAAAVCGCIALALERVRRMLTPVSRPLASGTIVLLAGVMVVPMLRASQRAATTPEKRDWRGLLSHLGTAARPVDAFAAVGPGGVPPGMGPQVWGVQRYLGFDASFLEIELTTPPTVLDDSLWTTPVETVWIVAHTNNPWPLPNEQLIAPTRTPTHMRVHTFHGFILLEIGGSGRAADRLIEGLAVLNQDLPDRRGLVAANLFRSRYWHARGREHEAEMCFEAARRQCQSSRDVDVLVREFVPFRTRLSKHEKEAPTSDLADNRGTSRIPLDD